MLLEVAHVGLLTAASVSATTSWMRMTLKTMEIKIIKSIQPTVFGTSVLIPPSASSDELINGSLAVGETHFCSKNNGQRSYSLTRRSKVYRRPTRVLGTKKLGEMLFF